MIFLLGFFHQSQGVSDASNSSIGQCHLGLKKEESNRYKGLVCGDDEAGRGCYWDEWVMRCCQERELVTQDLSSCEALFQMFSHQVVIYDNY